MAGKLDRQRRVDSASGEVAAIYAELDQRPLERSCQATSRCCRFHLTGEVPAVTLGEALFALRGWRIAGRKPAALELRAGACPFLDEASNRCRIYAYRPFACRTHFCAPAGGPYPRKHVADLIHRLEGIDAALGGRGEGQELTAAVRRARDRLGR